MGVSKDLLLAFSFLLVLNVTYGLQCFKCTGIAAVSDCTTLKECSAQQHCHARKYFSGSSVKYDLDCKPSSTCTLIDQTKRQVQSDPGDIEFWTSCCSRDHCNGKFDSEGTLHMPKGLECMDCTGVADPADCKTTSFCNSGEACLVHERFTDQGAPVFDLGCMASQVCLTLGFYLKTKRTELCRACCNADSCNREFCSAKIGQGQITPIGTAIPVHTNAPKTSAVKATTGMTSSMQQTTMTTESTVTAGHVTKTTTRSTTSTSDLQSDYQLLVTPTTANLKVGENTKLDCKFKPILHKNVTMTWLFADLTGVQHQVYTEHAFPPELQYLITNVKADDTGIYTCKAEYKTFKWTATATLIVS